MNNGSARTTNFPSTSAALTALDLLAAPVICALVLGVTAPSVLLAAAATGALLGRWADLQRSRLVLDLAADLPRLLGVSASSVLVLAAIAPSLGSVTPVALPVVLGAIAGLFALLVVLRGATYVAVTLLRRRGTIAHPVVIVGADQLADRLAQCLRDRPGHGLIPVGVVVAGVPETDTAVLSAPCLGEVSQLSQIMAEHDVDDVIFAGSGADAASLDALRRSLDEGHQVFVLPRFHELVGTDRHRRTELVRDIALTRLPRRPRRAVAPTTVSAPARTTPVRAASPVGRSAQRRPLAALLRSVADPRRAERRRELTGTSGWTEVPQVAAAADAAPYRNSYRQNLALFNELRAVAATHPAKPVRAKPVAVATATAPRPGGTSVLPRVGNSWGHDARRLGPTAPHHRRVGTAARR